jgi:DNA invertase Pin-like site-specific DNA recombinase
VTKLRCAIYTRKSSEEGLDQDFNSLDAQHEACAAYIKSQSSEGWKLVRERYDDGGISGGTLERPGLQRLLTDIAAGHVDIVVVYKVDRLTRSLLDFAKLVEAFDKACTSFVSITQSFNTTTSMGRLTLNMLLSFAQFEREVTAERIRDKIAQSKARGMWMGGTPPIGYRPDGRSLAIVEEQASLIRQIFNRYAELGNVRLLAEELEDAGICSPVRSAATGRAFGGRPFSRGHLYRILSNPIYIGRIDHGGRSHQANHPSIVEQELWDQVQDILAANKNGTRGPGVREASLLAGKLFDDRGVPMIATHACKGKVRYRYYVSRDLHHSGDARTSEGWRLPAREIEPLVRARIVALLNDPIELLTRATNEMLPPDELDAVVRRSKEAAATLAGPRARAGQQLRDLIAGIRLGANQVSITLSSTALGALLGVETTNETIELTVAGRLKRSGHVMRLIQGNGSSAAQVVDRTLVKAVVQGRNWWRELQSNTEMTIEDLARREGKTAAYIVRIVRLAFLSPMMLKRIIDGTLPAHLTVKRLCSPNAVPARWDRQFA